MIKIISPDQYKKIPWKNGKGETTELAISDGGSIDQFDWRISIASVLEDGPFSDFTGYMRNLVLIEGEGIHLVHDGDKTDKLEQLLALATFDGSCQTIGILKSGPITDFNVMTNHKTHKATVQTYLQPAEISLRQADHCFIYGLNSPLNLSASSKAENYTLPVGYLMHIAEQNMEGLMFEGKSLIVIYLDDLKQV